MTDIKVDAITSLMSLGSRTVSPTTAFAAYLDQAWCCTTETAAPESSNSTRDTAPRSSSTRNETTRSATDRLERDRNERDDDRIKDRMDDNAVAGYGPDEPHPQDESSSSSDAVTDEETSVDAAADGNDTQAQSADESTDNAKTTETADAQASAQQQEDSAADANGQSGGGAENPSGEAAEVAAVTEATSGQTTEGDAAETLTNTEETAADSTQASTNGETQSAPETTVADEVSSETASQGYANGGQDESEADAAKTSSSQDATAEGETELDGESQPDVRDETSQSRPHHEGPIAGREPGTTPGNQANGQSEAQTVNTPAQATTPTPDSATAAVAAATTTVEASSPTTPITSAGTTSVESVEGVTTETTATASSTRGTNPNAPTSGADQTDGVNRARFVQRVARAFQANGVKDGTIRMRLSPPELGSLRAEITVRQGVMNARLETETEAAKQLVLENLPALQERLAEQGIKVEQFQVDVADQQTGETADQMENQASSDGSETSEGDARRQSSRRNPMAEDTESPSDRRTRRADELGRLDVLV